MLNIDLSEINYLAMLVAALATFMLGGLWYTALFGKAWVRLHGYTPEQVKAMQQKRPPAVFFTVMIVSYLVLSFIFAILITSFEIASASGGAQLGLLLWIGVAAPILATAYIASDRHGGIFAIDGLYQLVFLVMVGAILGAWQ